MTEYQDLLPVAVEAIEHAHHLIRSRAPGLLTVKGDRDLASEVDYLIEREVRSFLHARTPGIGFLGEEEGATGSGDLHWALDPVDGTVNYVHGIPLCAVSLGLVSKGRPVIGVIDLPFLAARYTAVEGAGAYAGGRRIRTSTTQSLREAVVAIGDYAVGAEAARRNRLRLALTEQLAAQVQRIRMTGSAALDLVWLAEGKIDASLTLSNHPWDMAAGVAIAREAGAQVVDNNGTEHDSDSSMTLAVTPALATQVLALVHQAEMTAEAVGGAYRG